MLQQITKKLCPLMSLALATIACGKKINDSNSQPARSTENQERPSSMVLELDGTQGTSIKTYQMPQNGNFKVPGHLRVSGNAINKSVTITYEPDPYDADIYQFRCSYIASAIDDMVLDHCEDPYGDLGDVSESPFGLYKGDNIELRFTGAAATDLKVEAFYTVDWK